MRGLILPVLLAALTVSPLAAQTRVDPPRDLTMDIGVSSLPDALSAQCGSSENVSQNGGGTLGLSFLDRVVPHVTLAVDTRVIKAIGNLSCYLKPHAVDTLYDRRLKRDPFVTSSVRLGVETPASLPLFRLSAGVGFLWGAPARAIVDASLLWSSRNPGTRIFVEVDRSQTQVDAVERHILDPAAGTMRSIKPMPNWYSFRLGWAVPLRW